MHSVVSEEFGRLFTLRARDQNTVLVNLPASVMRDAELTLTVRYSGRLAPQSPDRETLLVEQGAQTSGRRGRAAGRPARRSTDS